MRSTQLILKLSLIALLLNFPWEMLQMPFFEHMYFSDPLAWLFCLIASIGDVAMTLVIFVLGGSLFRTWKWGQNLGFSKVLYLALAGLVFSVATEAIALDLHMWRYSDLMPILPVSGAGVVPVLQLLILPYAAIAIATRIFATSEDLHPSTDSSRTGGQHNAR